MATKSKGLQSPLMRKFRALQRAKKSFCAGKVTKAAVERIKKEYINMAVGKGQTKTEAQHKADRVTRAGCSMSSNIAGRKRRATSAKPRKKTTTTHRRKAASHSTRRHARA